MANPAVLLALAESTENIWTHIDFITCKKCLKHTRKHFDDMLQLLPNESSTLRQDVIYEQLATIINETFCNDKDQARKIRQQVRQLINEHLTETAQHVCLRQKNQPSLQAIADELSLLRDLFTLNKETGIASFNQLERFADVHGKVTLTEYGRRAIQSSERHSASLLRGRNLYTQNQLRNTFEIKLRIEHFYSCICIGICSDNVLPNDIEQASNVFPINPSGNLHDGDVFHLSINVNTHTMYLWNGYRPQSQQNSEQKKRERTISRRKCPFPWRFFVILTGKNNHVRIVY